MTAAQLTAELSALSERVANLRRELDESKAAQLRLEAALVESRHETTTVRVRLDEQVKRTDTWDNRRWMLFMAAIGLASSVTDGLIVALARKP